MSSQLNKFKDMLMQMQWNPVELISKHAAFFLVLLFIFILSIGVPIVNNLSSKQYYQDSMTKLVYAFLNSSYMLTKQFKLYSPTSEYRNISGNDAQLNETLIRRAKNGSNRYHLHDFEYFQIIRNEFPNTTSAVRLGCVTGFAPLLPTKLTPKDVLFIIMGSVKNIEKAKVLTKTWLQWSQGNFFIFADAADPSIPLTTLPKLEGKPTRDDAQHRQLLGSQWLIQNKSELIKDVKWFVFTDDDTWVNIPALLSYLQYFDHRLLLSIGYIWDDTWVTGWSYFAGGAGVVFSQAAFMSTMPAIYTKECPFGVWNDVTFMTCQKQKGVTKIYSDRFFYEKAHVVNTLRSLTPSSYVGHITFHYVNDAGIAQRMTCDTSVYWKWPIKGCDDVKRADMSHYKVQI